MVTSRGCHLFSLRNTRGSHDVSDFEDGRVGLRETSEDKREFLSTLKT